MNNFKISVAIATYNGERYILQQLYSIASQDITPDEVVICDDCSTDNTVEIIKSVCDSFPFAIKVDVNTHQLGYTQNFNRALSLTTGDIIFLSDQDDYWFHNKISHILSLVKRHPDKLMFMNDAILADGELRSYEITKLDQFKRARISESNFVMGCCAAVRRELLDIALPIGFGFKGHDSWLAMFADIFNSKLIDYEPLQLYRRHGQNESDYICNQTDRITFFKSVKFYFESFISPPEISNQIDQLKILRTAIRNLKLNGKYGSKTFIDYKYNLSKKIKFLTLLKYIERLRLFDRFKARIEIFFRSKSRGSDSLLRLIRDIVIMFR